MSRARILLPERVLLAMRREADRRFPAESGGVLLGYYDPRDDKNIQVLKQVGPGPKALHQRHRFEPDAEWQEKRIAAAYLNSETLVRYLGDWHSHPQGPGKPSALDRSTATRIAATPAARTPHPLIVILHGEVEDWDVAGFRLARRRLRRARVNPMNLDGSSKLDVSRKIDSSNRAATSPVERRGRERRRQW